MIEMTDKRFIEGTPENEAYRKQLKETAAYQERIFASDEQCRENNFARSEAAPLYNVEWAVVNDVKVLRCNDSKFVASKNGSKFAVIDIVAGQFICQLTSKEVKPWLIRAAKAENE